MLFGVGRELKAAFIGRAVKPDGGERVLQGLARSHVDKYLTSRACVTHCGPRNTMPA
jgi:hypothetical protein